MSMTATWDDGEPVTGLLVYGRQSKGNEVSIDSQLTIGQQRAETEGWPVLARYSDKVSASRRAKRERTEWPELLKAIPHHRGAVLWLWESSRGDRKLSTWAAMLESCRDAGVRIYVETDRRLYDMARLRDWRSLAEDGVDSEAESEKIRMRILRDTGPRAQEGRAYGKVPYGYQRRYELTGRGRRLLAQEEHPDEAPVVRFIFESVNAGMSLSAIMRDLNARGVPTRHGGPWALPTIRAMALNPAYIGKRMHAPDKTKTERHQMGKGVNLYDGQWDGLVSEELFYAVRRRLMDPERTTRRPGGTKHLLSRIAVCDVCGAPLGPKFPKHLGREPYYRCQLYGHVSVRMEDLDVFAKDQLLAHLSRPVNRARLRAASDGDDRELLAARAELAAAEAKLLSLRTMLGDGLMDEEDFAVAAPAAKARRDKARARVRALESPAPLRFLLEGPAEEMHERWRAATLTARRDAVANALRIRVKRAGHGRTPPVTERASAEFMWA